MISKKFIEKYGVDLIVEYNKSNILFKTDNKNFENEYVFKFHFEKNIFQELIKYLESISREIWKDFNPREADSMSADYEEYYDRKYDSEGCLSIFKDIGLKIEKPCLDSPYLYKFNKRRMESFIYDLKR